MLRLNKGGNYEGWRSIGIWGVTGIEANEKTYEEVLENKASYILNAKHIIAPVKFKYGFAQHYKISTPFTIIDKIRVPDQSDEKERFIIYRLREEVLSEIECT